MKKRQIPFLFLTKGRNGLEKKWRHRLAKVIFVIIIIWMFCFAFYDEKPYFSQRNATIIKDSEVMGEYFPNLTLEQETKLIKRLDKEMLNSTSEEKYKEAKKIINSWEVKWMIDKVENQITESEYNKLKRIYHKRYFWWVIHTIIYTYILYLILQTLYYKIILYITHWKPKKIV